MSMRLQEESDRPRVLSVPLRSDCACGHVPAAQSFHLQMKELRFARNLLSGDLT